MKSHPVPNAHQDMVTDLEGGAWLGSSHRDDVCSEGRLLSAISELYHSMLCVRVGENSSCGGGEGRGRGGGGRGRGGGGEREGRGGGGEGRGREGEGEGGGGLGVMLNRRLK